jgi:hypothetical protein
MDPDLAGVSGNDLVAAVADDVQHGVAEGGVTVGNLPAPKCNGRA